MVIGASYTLKVSGTSDSVKWSSSDKSVVTVSSKGKIKATGLGSAAVTAKVGKSSLKCKVTVIAGTISLNKSSVKVTAGKTALVKATVKGIKSVGCSSSNAYISKGSIGPWDNKQTVNIKIKGIKAGTSKIKVYLTEDRSISKTITVKVVPDKEENNTENPDEKSAVEDMSYAEQVLYYVNIEREKAGVTALELDDKLCEAADIRSAELLTSYSHTRPDGTECFTVLDDVGCKKGAAAENIACGYKSAEEVVNGWMDSKGHRTNILNPQYTIMGASMAYDKNLKYKYYWAQVFS